MEMSRECLEVIDSVRSLAMHSSPSMFWKELHLRTTMNADRASGILRRWALGDDLAEEFEDRLNLLSYALDIRSESMYKKSWDELCGQMSWPAICEIGEIA